MVFGRMGDWAFLSNPTRLTEYPGWAMVGYPCGYRSDGALGIVAFGDRVILSVKVMRKSRTCLHPTSRICGAGSQNHTLVRLIEAENIAQVAHHKTTTVQYLSDRSISL